MKKLIISGIFLFLVCSALPACAVIQNSKNADSASAVAMARHAQVRQSLDQLITAYEAKNIRQFSKLVNDSYNGEASIFDSAVRRDFSAYNNLSLRYTVNNITLDANGVNASITITFTRSWTDIKTSKTKNETKETSLVFELVDGSYKLQNQRGSRLFGLN